MHEFEALSASGGTTLCPNDDGKLVVVAAHTGDSRRPFGDSFPRLLPALERPWAEFWADAEQRASAAGLDADRFQQLIPEEGIVISGFA